MQEKCNVLPDPEILLSKLSKKLFSVDRCQACETAVTLKNYFQKLHSIACTS